MCRPVSSTLHPLAAMLEALRRIGAGRWVRAEVVPEVSDIMMAILEVLAQIPNILPLLVLILAQFAEILALLLPVLVKLLDILVQLVGVT